MLIIISPAKTLDFDEQDLTEVHTTPEFLGESQILVDQLAGYQPEQLSKLMGISEKLATLNAERFETWSQPFTTKNAKQCLLAFKGDVYQGLSPSDYDEEDFAFAQDHLRILSGLYGLLRPLDLMQPYRLEMGTKLENERGTDLYSFWGDQITQALNAAIAAQGDDLLINLASNEYFNSIRKGLLKARIITPVFKDWKNDKLKIISFYAKKARGMMSDYIIKNRIADLESLKAFNSGGYGFDAELSDEKQLVFVRPEQ